MRQEPNRRTVHTIVSCAALFVFVSAMMTEVSSAQMMFGRGGGSEDYAPEVRIISPDREAVDLTGKESLTLHWSWIEGDRFSRQYYDVRVYRGYDTLEKTLLFKARADPGTDRLDLPAALFADGGVYTWTIRQRYIGMAKSRRSYASFTVIKR